MEIDEAGANLIKSFESCRLSAYLPTAHDIPTIGWGSTGPDIHLGMAWTQEQADKRFASDLRRFSASVTMMLAGARTTQNQFSAMVSLAYNIGAANFSSSTLLRKHKAGDYDGATQQFGRWTHQGKQVLNGLVRRRAAEARMYAGLA